MRWIILAFWLAVALLANKRFARLLLASGLILSFAGQYTALYRAGLFSVQSALPLHLCGASAVLALLALALRRKAIFDMLWLYGAPCAVLAVIFPAMLETGDSRLMAYSFYSVHALIAAVSAYGLRRLNITLPTDGRAAFLCLLGFSLLVGAVNSLCNCNYLFLRAAPESTPLAFLYLKGRGAYTIYLFMAAMCLSAYLPAAYSYINPLSGSRSLRSPPCRYS